MGMVDPSALAGCALALYAVWLLAGLADFMFHRQSDLSTTSGLRESVLHGVQIGLIGAGVLVWLALAPTRGVAAVLLAITAVHALVAWLDTASADGRRRIAPLEQHVHSVLDASPWVFSLGMLLLAPRGWALHLDPRPPAVWVVLLVPAVLLVGVPWLLELRAAWTHRWALRPPNFQRNAP